MNTVLMSNEALLMQLREGLAGAATLRQKALAIQMPKLMGIWCTPSFHTFKDQVHANFTPLFVPQGDD